MKNHWIHDVLLGYRQKKKSVDYRVNPVYFDMYLIFENKCVIVFSVKSLRIFITIYVVIHVFNNYRR